MATFAAFLFAYLLSQFFRSFLAVVAPDLKIELGLDATSLGLISAAWFAAFAVAQIPVGAALDRFGPRRTTGFLLLAAVGGALLFAAARDAATCIAAMALIGVGCAPVLMGALYFFGRTQKPERFALLAAWLIAAGSLGNLLAATPLAWSAANFGWRPAFVAIAVLTLLAALVVLAVVRDPARAVSTTADGTPARNGLLQVLGIRALWPMLPLIFVSYAVIAAERGLWLGPFLTEAHGFDAIARGNAALAMSIAMSAGALAYGPLERLLGTRKWLVFFGSVVTAAGFFVLGLAPQLDGTAAVIVLTVIGFAGLTYGTLMAHGRTFFPDHLLGRGITMMNFMFMVGAGLLQVGSGRLIETLAASGLPAAQQFASLHLMFAVALAAATTVYLAARER